MMDMAKICDTQSEIIKMQSDIIDDLFLQLLNYVSIDEEEKEIGMIETVANLEKDYEQ